MVKNIYQQGTDDDDVRKKTPVKTSDRQKYFSTVLILIVDLSTKITIKIFQTLFFTAVQYTFALYILHFLQSVF